MGRDASLIRIGILGASRIVPGAILDPVAKRDDCEIVAIGCSDPHRGAEFAARHSISSVCSDYHELVRRDDVDLVYNALPPSRHADLSIAALAAGKSVLCEKPFAMNASEAAQMVIAAKHSKGHLIEAFHYRHHPAFQFALSAVKDRQKDPAGSRDLKLNDVISATTSAFTLHWSVRVLSGETERLSCVA